MAKLLSQLDLFVDPTILQRGRTYFEEGAVICFEEVLPGQWQAEVAGSADYTVEVSLQGEEILQSFCDCPFTGGEFCKHEIAVFLEISADLEREAFAKSSGQPQKLARQQPFHELLASVAAKISSQEWETFVGRYAQQHPEFRDHFLIYFADRLPGTPTAIFHQKVRAAFRSAAGSKGYLEQNEAEEIVDTFREWIEEEKLLPKDKQKLRLPSLLSELEAALTEAIKSAEDWEGYLQFFRSEIQDMQQAL